MRALMSRRDTHRAADNELYDRGCDLVEAAPSGAIPRRSLLPRLGRQQVVFAERTAVANLPVVDHVVDAGVVECSEHLEEPECAASVSLCGDLPDQAAVVLAVAARVK
jgi:hypothetical protein